MTTPPSVVVYRGVIVLITLLILLSAGFGVAGDGPLAALHQIASPVSHELHLDRISGRH
jgi:hypothetical protein